MINPYDYYITDEEYAIAEKHGISKDTLNFRIRRMGWDKEKALTTKPRKYTNRAKQVEIAKANGISRATLWKVEKGSPAVAMGIYAAVLHALNNMDKDLLLVAKDDVFGRQLQDLGLIMRKRATKRTV